MKNLSGLEFLRTKIKIQEIQEFEKVLRKSYKWNDHLVSTEAQRLLTMFHPTAKSRELSLQMEILKKNYRLNRYRLPNHKT